MTKAEVLIRFCRLSSVVRDHLCKENTCAADCFCPQRQNNPFVNLDNYFCFDESVLQFIERATAAKLKTAKRAKKIK